MTKRTPTPLSNAIRNSTRRLRLEDKLVRMMDAEDTRRAKYGDKLAELNTELAALAPIPEPDIN